MCFIMAHSKDLRARVCGYVRGGGSKSEAARIFSVGRTQVYAWLRLGDDLTAKKPGPKGPHKISHEALKNALDARPDKPFTEIGATVWRGPQCGALWFETATHHPQKKLGDTLRAFVMRNAAVIT